MLKIGPYRISSLETHHFKLDGGAMFGVVPKALWHKKAPADEHNRIEMGMNALFLQDDTRNIIVDTGVGTKWTEKMAGIYAIDLTEGGLVGSLKAHGLTPDDVTDVILTHLHFDHVGGATVMDGDQAVPAFPNATYYVQKGQWDWAHARSDKDKASYMPKNYHPLKESGQLEIVEGEFEILPHVHTVVVNGHTVDQQLLKVTDGKTTLFHCGDLIPMSPHVPIPWVMAYDLHPLKTIEEKHQHLARAVDDDWILFFEHDPFTMLGRVEKSEKGYKLKDKLSFKDF